MIKTHIRFYKPIISQVENIGFVPVGTRHTNPGNEPITQSFNLA